MSMTGDGPAISELVRQMQDFEKQLEQITTHLQGDTAWGRQGLVMKVDSIAEKIEDHRRMIDAIREEQVEEEERREAERAERDRAQKRNERFLSLIAGGVLTIIAGVTVAVLTNALGV